jgi:hypothetical protein
MEKQSKIGGELGSWLENAQIKFVSSAFFQIADMHAVAGCWLG